MAECVRLGLGVRHSALLIAATCKCKHKGPDTRGNLTVINSSANQQPLFWQRIGPLAAACMRVHSTGDRARHVGFMD